MRLFRNPIRCFASFLLAFSCFGAESDPARVPGQAFAIPTFHCLGLYWSPPGGSADKPALVRYRAQGASEWQEALPMRYHPIPETDEDLTDYRGSSLSNHRANIDNSYDYDLFNGQVPAGVEEHGVRGEPKYIGDAGFDRTARTGQFQLAAESPGVGAGEWIPNFSEGSRGSRPDIGAHPRGAPPMRFGVGVR